MTASSSLPTPLGDFRQHPLARELAALSAEQLLWLSGYAYGLAQRGAGAIAAVPATEAKPALTATVLYGSQTGNAKRLAEQLYADLQAQGIQARLLRASDYPTRELAQEKLLLVAISTQGEGEPPEDSIALFKFLASNRAPKLAQLKYAIFGLGDRSYNQFCAAGKNLGELLGKLGASEWQPRVDADVEYDADAKNWRAQIVEQAKKLQPASNTPSAQVLPLRPAAASVYHRDKPFPAPVLAVQKITARDSRKDVRHVELSLAGSGLSYEPGDTLGVWPRNPDVVVSDVLQTLQLDGEVAVLHDGETLSLRRWLKEKRELTQLARPVLERYQQIAQQEKLAELLKPAQASALQAFLTAHQFIDVLQQFPARLSAEQLLGVLRPLTPRLYSIASSQKVVGEEVHLTVGVIDEATAGGRRVGAASRFLADISDADTVDVFIEHNPSFRLPEDDSRDLILIGPGTGIAPFRAFVQERTERAASGSAGGDSFGKIWLFFGNQHFTSQFLYQTEWQAALKSGALSKLSLAFSRDQQERIYVQHRLREQAKDVYEWLERGAAIYLCGDAKQMAPDVHAALREIIAEQSGKDAAYADDYLDRLREEGRYRRDVY